MKSGIEDPDCSVPRDHRVSSRTIRTFLADDDPLLMALLARILSKDKRIAIVGSAPDGPRALRNAWSLAPDLVVTDLRMPGLDGAEVTRHLKQRLNAPIVFIATSDDTPEARARCVAAGVDAFLVKAGNVAPRLLSAIREFFPDDGDGSNAETQPDCESLTAVG
jgi:DNA-binding NarL/FixJ family response regulator